ncbi:NB-ARC domain-containing protein [Streptomyces sp. NBC_00391]|uniref:NB-ARC domain-containing protein n=1 Tax=Streptomyces sp. NBC_00391 TaxID=2903647 RepID=UPI002E1ED087
MTLAAASAVLAVLLALAGNAATSTARWPGVLDELRRHPWPWVGVLGALTFLSAGVLMWMQVRPPAGRDDPPLPPPVTVPDWFVDRAQTRATAAAVCRGGRAVGITTSLWGAGGFGKTTLATAVCARRRVRWRFRSRIYHVTIGRDVRGRAAVAAKVAEVTRFITGDTTEFDDPNLAGAHLGRLLDQRPRTLLVLDDAWEPEQLAPFLTGGRRCVRLVTTRNPSLLPSGAVRIQVDQMSYDQAEAVLTWDLPPLPSALVDALLNATGRWALLLRLTNRLIAEQCAAGADPAATAARTLQRLRSIGPAAVDAPDAVWDLDDPVLRNQAVKASVEAATTLLPSGGADRFTELGIFAEDESVPVSVVALLWQAGGGLADDETRVLCRTLERLSLCTVDPRRGGTISLHDVIRDYLRGDLGPVGLVSLNGRLIDAIAATLPPAQPLVPTAPAPERAWWQLQDGYLLDHLIDHLLAAGRAASAEAVAGDLRWVEARLVQRGPGAPWTDLARIDTPHTRLLARSLAQTAHLLTPTRPSHVLTGVLHTRLDTHPLWQPPVTARRRDPAQRPCLATRWPLPDAPSPALLRTLAGHSGRVCSVVFAPDGTWLVTAGEDGRVRIWDRATGTCTATLNGHTNAVNSVAVAQDGTWLATAGEDGKVRIWDRATGTCTATLNGHTNAVNSVAVAQDGTWLATAGEDGRARIWDRATGTCTATLDGPTGPVAIAPDGSWLATSSGGDRTVRIWDRATGACTAALTGPSGSVNGLAVARDGTWLAAAGNDGRVRIWDRATGGCTVTLTVPTYYSLTSVAIAPDGAWLATAGDDRTVRIWDRATAACTATLDGDTHGVNSVAIAPDGSWLATAHDGGTVRIWDHASITPTSSRPGHTARTKSVVFASAGTWLAAVCADGKARIWDRASETCTATLTIPAARVTSVAFAPDGSWLATAGDDETVRIWDRATGSCTATLDGPTVRVNSMAVARDGTWLATSGDDDRTVRIWDRVTGACTTTLTGLTSPVTSVAVAREGTSLAAAGDDGTVQIWDWAYRARRVTLTVPTRDSLRSVAIAPNGTWLAAVCRAGWVWVWERYQQGRSTGWTFPRVVATGANSVAIAQDSSWLAACGVDGTVRIWAATGQDVVAVARTEGALLSAAWGTDHELAVGGERGLYLFQLLT